MILDRRPLLALALGGLLVTGIAVMLVTRPLWHQVFTPRVLASVVITAVIVIVPTVLELVPPTVRMVWGLAFVAFGGVAALATALVHLTRGSPEVLHAEDALSLGMVGGLVAGGGVVLVARAVRLLREAGVEHLGWAEERSGEGYVPVCACGWEGEPGPSSSQALEEAGDHAGRVRLTGPRDSGRPRATG
ncbi:hypothetical protein [Nonomuraea harbinensis]|uniref:Uncharacterized protein n=1 Tax=Nonomuraea harbinensis TaxID=1286938 RepID=A0ABW1BZE1_9ACTN|nr:hypothetical protein [Nonomuraea harbinensis]